MAEFSDPPERFLKLAEVSQRVGLRKSMIYVLLKEQRFPAPYKISPFASRWSEQEIVAEGRLRGQAPEAVVDRRSYFINASAVATGR